jgi:molecular chaperone DnaK
LGTGNEQKIEIKSSSGLSQAEVEKMRRDAELHAEEDKKRRELIDAKNEADQRVWQLEKQLKEVGEKISAADKAPIQSAIDKVKAAQKGEDLAAIKQAVSELEAAAHAMAAHVQSNKASAGPAAGGDGKKDDVIDAEFEVKK